VLLQQFERKRTFGIIDQQTIIAGMKTLQRISDEHAMDYYYVCSLYFMRQEIEMGPTQESLS